MLSGAWNFRDVSGLKTSEGRCVASGLLFRSSELSNLDDTGGQDLINLGVTDVFDLRDYAEIEKTGAGRVPDSIEVHVVPFDLRPDGKAPHEMSRDDYYANRTRYMYEVYQQMPTLPGAMSTVDQVIKLLGDPDRRVLVHCAAGKDRTGWVVAAVLAALEVNDDDIMSDYLKSNADIESLRAHLQRSYGSADGEPIEISDELLGVRAEFLQSAQAAAAEKFGTFDEYLAACRVTPGDLDRLRARMLT
jgi:protein-tyrosine phosphatase